MVTIKDVAKRAGVAASTVSYVINNKKSVKKETRERIINAIEELNYSPNLVARSLKTKITHTIGVIVPDLSNMFFTDIIRGIEDTMSKEGYVIILCSTYENIEKEKRDLSILLKKDIDGLIYVSAGKNRIYISDHKIPIVLVDRKIGESYLSVMVNNKKGGFLATDHLLDKNNAEVFILTGPLTINTYFERMNGYIEALKKHGYEYNEHLVINCDSSYAGGIKAIEELLKNKISFRSIFAANDLIALGAMKAIIKNGLRIPNDVSIVGFDDISTSAIVNPSLTTIRQPKYLMGVKAAELILDQLNNRSIDNRHILLEPEIIVRETT
jgi:LacI family transcriptional regulator